MPERRIALNIRDLSTLESAAKWLNELIQTCRKYGPVYSSNPKLTANVSRRAKTLSCTPSIFS